MDPKADTRGRLVEAATALFAERGFYGTSIAAVADELGLTKQALLHHFSSKEKLYGAVLEQLSERLMAELLGALRDEASPEAQLEAFFDGFCTFAMAHPDGIRLVLRELMDNKARAEAAGVWYLKDFLETLVALVQATRRWQGAGAAQALTVVYQLLGAINFYAVSGPTLQGIFGTETCAGSRQAFPEVFRGLVRAAVT